MSAASLTQLAVTMTLTWVLCWAAYSDIRSRIIPNTAVLSVIGLFLLWTLSRGGEGLASALIAAAVVFVATTVLFGLGAIGAGDAKLMASLTLFAGTALLFPLIMATTLAGGVIALFALARDPERAFAMIGAHFHDDNGLRVPYGVAIAIGGIVLIWSETLGLPVWDQLRQRLANG